jgi:hypothetical protein
MVTMNNSGPFLFIQAINFFILPVAGHRLQFLNNFQRRHLAFVPKAR